MPTIDNSLPKGDPGCVWIFIIGLFIIISFFILSCTHCDGDYWQIKEKKQEATGCTYVAMALCPDYKWQKSKYITFKDSCSVYLLSRIVREPELEKYK